MFLGAGEIITAHNHGYISIGGWSNSCPSGGGYRLRVGTSLTRYTNEEYAHESIDMSGSPSISEPIPSTGYALIPGMVYVIQSHESGASSIYNIMLASTEEGVLRGINVLGSGMLSANTNVAISVTQPLIIRPMEYYAKLQFHKDPEQPI